MTQNKGWNKRLHDRRIELGLSLKEAGKLLHIPKVIVRLTEEGYIPVLKKKQKIYIDAYKLEEDFFENDLGYPIILKEDEVKYNNPRFYKIINALWFKITCFALCFGFIGLTIGGAVLNHDCNHIHLSFLILILQKLEIM